MPRAALILPLSKDTLATQEMPPWLGSATYPALPRSPEKAEGCSKQGKPALWVTERGCRCEAMLLLGCSYIIVLDSAGDPQRSGSQSHCGPCVDFPVHASTYPLILLPSYLATQLIHRAMVSLSTIKVGGMCIMDQALLTTADQDLYLSWKLMFL